MHSIPLYLVWDSDHLSAEVKRLEQADDAERLRILYQRIDRANEIVKAWVVSVGGSTIAFAGASGSAEVPAERAAELPKIRVQYREAIDAPLSIGVGTKLSEAQKALQLLQLKGGDSILLYTPDVDQEIAQRTEQSTAPQDPLSGLLEKGLKNAVAAGAIAAGLMVNPGNAHAPVSYPTQHAVAPPKPSLQKWNPAGLRGDLYPIAHLESSFGKRVNHAPHSLGEFNTAVGAVGLKPVSAHETFLRNPDLQRRFPQYFDKAKFTQALKTDHPFYNQIASAHWDELAKRLHNKVERVAYAWRHGRTAALMAPPDRIKADPYVQKYLALRAKGIYKMEREDFDLEALAKDESHPAEIAASGFDKPKAEASEHSEGEAAAHIFEEGAPPKTNVPSDVAGHLHKLAGAQAQQEDADRNQEKQDKELAQIKSGVMTVLQHVKQLQPQFAELSQTAPEVYKTVLEMVQSMIVLARELDESPTVAKSESSLTKDEGQLPPNPAPQAPQSQNGTGAPVLPKLPKAAKPFKRHHLTLPVGTKIDGKGKIKVQHGDGSTSWVEARSGQIASQDKDSAGTGGEVHPISARNPTGR